MFKVALFIAAFCLFPAGLSCEGDGQQLVAEARIASDATGSEDSASSRDGFDNPFADYLYHQMLQSQQQQQRMGDSGDYEGRGNSLPHHHHYSPSAPSNRYGYNEPVQSRVQTNLLTNIQSGFNTAFPAFSSTKPNVNLASFFTGRPNLFSLNPNFPNLLTTFDSCTAPSGESGICTPGKVCSLSGGRPSGSCILGGVCCINIVSACGGTVSLNNTYWQSPNPASTSPASSLPNSICSLNVKLDSNLIEQKKPICQIRLNFVTFSIAQPNAQSVCDVDTFQAGGALDTVPTICGENPGQHMYINVPNSDITASNLQLIFKFGATTTARSWSIRIAMLPCGADYLAPAGCLQYFTSSSGTVSSFNWKDVAGTTTRQLANQNYQICFRTELVTNQGAAQTRANSLCFTPCTVTSTPAPNAFSVSVATTAANSQSADDCNNDFVIIPGGFNPAIAVTTVGNALDRYCGVQFNTALNNAASATVCTTVKPFNIVYRTNGDETVTAKVDTLTAGNLGFCLSFSERST